MSDELGVHAVLIIKTLLERQQTQHQIHRFVNRACAALPPGPDLGTHVLDGRDPGGAQVARQPEVEFGCVDADEYVRFGAKKLPSDARAQAQQSRQMTHYLEQAHHRKRFGRFPALASFGLHFGAGNPEESSIRGVAAQRADQIGAQGVARRLSRNQAHPQRELHACYRTMLRSLRLMNSTKGRISSWVTATFSSSSRAFLNFNPDR